MLMPKMLPRARRAGGLRSRGTSHYSWCCEERRIALMPQREAVLNPIMIRKLKSNQYRLYSRKVDPKTGKRRNLGTFDTREEAEKHERAVQFFKRGGGKARASR